MSFKIAIASGKGGTGKTTVAINLFHFIKNNITQNVQLVDCDVEEPNDAIFIPNKKLTNTIEANQLIPEINNENCTFCRKCVDYCEFNAIAIIPSAKFTNIDANLCHSCGACSVACESNAITEKPNPIGEINTYSSNASKGLLEGKLQIGSAMQTLLINQVKEQVFEHNEITIYDAPPGTSCSVVETVSDADYVILVSEPTPFGLYDLRLMVELLYKLKIPFGVIVNKAGLGDDKLDQYLKNECIELLGEIPFSKAYASNYSNGKLLEDIPAEVVSCFNKITEHLGIKMALNKSSKSQ